MPKFEVTGTVTHNFTVEVEADNEDAAYDKVNDGAVEIELDDTPMSILIGEVYEVDPADA